MSNPYLKLLTNQAVSTGCPPKRERFKLRSSIKRLLRKHGYPPDKQPAAIKLVMEQMETMAPRYASDRERSKDASL